MALNLSEIPKLFKPTFEDNEVPTQAGNIIIPKAYGSIINSGNLYDDAEDTSTGVYEAVTDAGNPMQFSLIITKEMLPCTIILFFNAFCAIHDRDEGSIYLRLRETGIGTTLSECNIQKSLIRDDDEYEITPMSIIGYQEITTTGTYTYQPQIKDAGDPGRFGMKYFNYLLFTKQT